MLWSATALGQTPVSAPILEIKLMQPASTLPAEPAYVALSRGQKFTTFATQLYSPFTFAAAGLSGGWGQMTDSPPEYGDGMEGYGKRFGCSLADTELSTFFNKFLYPAILRQDPRYFPAQPGASMRQRAQYAVTRVLITRHDSGRSQFNYSEALGNLSNASLANAYFASSQRTFGKTMFRFGSLFAADALGNLGREFWPDIWRRLRGRNRAQSAALFADFNVRSAARLPESP